jgi:integrase
VAVVEGEEQPVMRPKYCLHALRDFYCLWCAEPAGRRARTGPHGASTLAMTADPYGHLFPATDDAEVLAAGERARWMGV